MKILEYAQIHCKDLLDRFNKQKDLDLLAGYPYDEIVYDEDDTPVRVVNTQSGQIPIADILGMPRDEFAKVYPDEESLTAYDKYVSMFIFLEGEEAVNQIRNAIAQESQRLEEYQVPGEGVAI